jgi:hypothetical protein
MEGYVKLHRSLVKWEWHDDPNTGWLFIMLLLLANHEDNRWHGEIIRRGQLVTSLNNLSEVSGVSVRSIRTGLVRLEYTGEIKNKSTKRYRIITICNYDKYQDVDNLADKQPTNNRQTTDKQPTINKNEKNEKNISSPSARVRVEDIPGYIAGLAGTERMESMIREVFRLTGTVPDGDTMASLVQRWIDELRIQGTEEKQQEDICTHFISWARIAIPAENRKGKSNITKTNLQNNEERYFLKLPDGWKPFKGFSGGEHS